MQGVSSVEGTLFCFFGAYLVRVRLLCKKILEGIRMKCTQCGNEFEGNFCPVCGTRAALPQGSQSAPLAQAGGAGQGTPPQGTAQHVGGQLPPQGTAYRVGAAAPAPSPAAAPAAAQAAQPAAAQKKWEPGQPRVKSENALLLQWGCFLLALLMGVCGFVFAFVNIFEYTIAGVSVEAYSAFDYFSGMFDFPESSVFYGYKAYFWFMDVFYLLPMILGVKAIYDGIADLGCYDVQRRKSIFFDALIAVIFSLLAMIVYIVFSSSFFGDMPIAIGSLGVLPYVCFGINLLLFLLALGLKTAKNEDGHAAVTFWETSGIKKPLTKKRVAVEIIANCLVALAIILIYLFCPILTDGVNSYSTVQAYSSELIWKSEVSFAGSSNDAAMASGRGILGGTFAAMALYAGLCILLAFLYAKDPKKWYKRRSNIFGVGIPAIFLLWALIMLALMLNVDLDVYSLQLVVPALISYVMLVCSTLFCNILTVDLRRKALLEKQQGLRRGLF